MKELRMKAPFSILLIASILFLPLYSYVKGNYRWRHCYTRGSYGRITDLKQIGLGIMIYSSDNYYGTMPLNLWDLYDDGKGVISDPMLLASPGDSEPQAENGDWGQNRYHYLFEGGADPSNIRADTPIVIYATEHGYTVLFMDTHVKFYSRENFHEVFNSKS